MIFKLKETKIYKANEMLTIRFITNNDLKSNDNMFFNQMTNESDIFKCFNFINRKNINELAYLSCR